MAKTSTKFTPIKIRLGTRHRARQGPKKAMGPFNRFVVDNMAAVKKTHVRSLPHLDPPAAPQARCR